MRTGSLGRLRGLIPPVLGGLLDVSTPDWMAPIGVLGGAFDVLMIDFFGITFEVVPGSPADPRGGCVGGRGPPIGGGGTTTGVMPLGGTSHPEGLPDRGGGGGLDDDGVS